MKQKTLFILTAVILLLAFAAGTLLYTSEKQEETTQSVALNQASLLRMHSPTLGNAEARVLIVEFFDPALKAIIEEAPLISVVSCSCRKRQEALGNPCRLSHDMNCIQFSRAAEYTQSRGHGRMLSKEEALQLIEETEDHGLVHQWPNVSILSTHTLCSCCDDCCIYLDSGLKHGTVSRTLERSHLRAEVDPEICNGCQDCGERCLFEVIEMKKTPQAKKLKAVVDVDKCFGCGVCVISCSLSAIEMKLHRPAG